MSNKSFPDKVKETIFTNIVYYYSCLENIIRGSEVKTKDDNIYINDVFVKNNVVYTLYSYHEYDYIWCNNKNIDLNIENFSLTDYKPDDKRILSACLVDNEIEVDVTDIVAKYAGHGDFHKNLCFFKCSDILDNEGQTLVMNDSVLKIITYMGDDFEYRVNDLIRI